VAEIEWNIRKEIHKNMKKTHVEITIFTSGQNQADRLELAIREHFQLDEKKNNEEE
jgi:predicted transposase YbfD/YdcC